MYYCYQLQPKCKFGQMPKEKGLLVKTQEDLDLYYFLSTVMAQKAPRVAPDTSSSSNPYPKSTSKRRNSNAITDASKVRQTKIP